MFILFNNYVPKLMMVIDVGNAKFAYADADYDQFEGVTPVCL